MTAATLSREIDLAARFTEFVAARPIKEIANATGMSPRAVSLWRDGNPPSLAAFQAVLARYPEAIEFFFAGLLDDVTLDHRLRRVQTDIAIIEQELSHVRAANSLAAPQAVVDPASSGNAVGGRARSIRASQGIATAARSVAILALIVGTLASLSDHPARHTRTIRTARPVATRTVKEAVA